MIIITTLSEMVTLRNAHRKHNHSIRHAHAYTWSSYYIVTCHDCDALGVYLSHFASDAVEAEYM